MIYPDFSFEQKLWGSGIKFVAGADEVGRGAFAGPIVAATTVFAPIPNSRFPIFSKEAGVTINDSKKMTPKQRSEVSEWIKENALSWGIGECSVSLINRLGIVKATHIAFRRAIQKLFDINHLLVDAFYVPYTKNLPKRNQTPIIKGDQKSFSIAAASIIAKVHRDTFMTDLSGQYKVYKWGANKGYGTLYHREAIRKHGTTKHHRKLFVRNN